jgi:hypothetical protein
MEIANPEQTRKIMQEVGKVNGEYFSSSDSGSSLVSGENLSSSNYTSSSGLGDEEVAEALTRDVHIEQSGLILVHHPVDPYVGLPNHCPSFGSVQDFMYADCDCIAKHHLAECCQQQSRPTLFLIQLILIFKPRLMGNEQSTTRIIT